MQLRCSKEKEPQLACGHCANQKRRRRGREAAMKLQRAQGDVGVGRLGRRLELREKAGLPLETGERKGEAGAAAARGRRRGGAALVWWSEKRKEERGRVRSALKMG
ncbi:hypothetical protein JCGZ_24200 [Jatropha curcas]|uniref:Uncharacterized protein n=1 Tax=Jatropha curcas TaxID=180498 RepID=A0A067LGJ9_JATCU|nr:hypothetical protein JCGZ_24200 [Jatropha curcas]